MPDGDALRRRVHEEAEAAASAVGLAATLAHLAIATAYARRLRGDIPNAAASEASPAP